MTDISQLRELRNIATMDASNYEAGARKIEEANRRVAASEQQVQAESEKTGRAISVTERSMVALESRLGGVSKASADLARALTLQAQAEERAARGIEAGTITEDRANRIRSDAAKLVGQRNAALKAAQEVENIATLQSTAHAAAQGRLGAVMADTTGKTKLSAFQLQNLSFQINDVVTGLTTGQRPLQVLMQQGPQITQVFGGVGATFRAAGGALLSIGVPALAAAAAITVLAGGFALGITRAATLDHQLKELRTTLAATGGATGISAADLQAQTLAFARQPGVSRDTATQASQALASNPLVNADLLRRALPTVRDFAVATGKDIPEAARAMAAALTGGYSAAKQLDAQFQLLSVAELDQIRNLEEQGRKGEAANIVLAAMQRQFKGLADGALTDAAKATNSLGNAWDNMLDSLAKSGPIQRARQQLIDLLNAIANFDGSKISDPAVAIANPVAWLAKRLAESGVNQIGGLLTSSNTLLNRQITAGQAIAGLGETGDLESATSLMDGFRKAAAGAADAVTRISAGGAGGQGPLHGLAQQADEARQALDPAGEEIRRLSNLLTLFGNALDAGVMKSKPFADAMQALAVALRQVQTPENILADLEKEAKLAGMSPAARAGQIAADRMRNRPGGASDANIEAARKIGVRGYYAGQGVGLGEQIAGIRAGATGTAGVIAAYAQSTEAGRRAEIELKALEAQYKNGAAAVRAYADALLAQDAAQRRVEGARDLAKLKDDIADTEKLNAALAESTAAYEREKIAVEAAAKVRQGYLTPAQAADFTTTRLRALTQEYERQAIALTRQLDPVARLNDELKTLAELQATGKLSAKAFQEAMTDAYVRAGQASDSFLQGATAGLLEYARQAQQVGAAMADAVVRAFSAADDAIAKLLLRRSVDFRQFLSDVTLDITRAFVRQSITGPIASALGGLFVGSPSAGRSATVSIGGVQYAPVGGGSGSGLLGSLSGGGFNPFGIFGSNGSLGSWLSSPISGFPSASAFEGVIPGMSGAQAQQFISGASGGGLFNTTTWGQGLGALAGIGSSIFSFASGNPIGGAAGLLGAGVSLIPGIGQIAGPIISIASSILGGLFKQKTFPEAQGWHTYDPATGRYVGRATFERGGMTAPIATSIGNDALKLIGAFGGSVAPGASAPDYYIWKGYEAGKLDATVTAESSPTYRRLLEKAWASGQVHTTEEAQWAARTELWSDTGAPLPINAPSTDSNTLMQQLALLILKAGVRDNAFTGLSGTSQTIIRNFPDADTQGLAEALQWGKQTYDTLLRGDTITAAEKALTDLRDSFTAAIAKAKDLGLATDGLAAAQSKAINKYATDFGQNITDQLLGLSDPAALQRVQIERAREAALKEWDYLNQQYLDGQISTLIDRNKINELYDKQLVQVTSQTLVDLSDLQKRLLYGDLSGATPADVVTGTSGTYQALLAQAMAGDGAALAKLSGAGSDYVNAAQLAYGHDIRFASIRDSVLANINNFIGNGGAATGSGSGTNDNNIGATITALTTMVQNQASQIAALMEQNAILIARIDRLVA